MKTLKKLSALALLIILVLIGCQRNWSDFTPTLDANGEFTKKFTKEWYLKSFKKTEEWKTARVKVNKFPSFKKGTGFYRKEGDWEMWEFPLQRQKKEFLVQAEKQGLTEAQIKKVASSSISRVLFIRTPGNKIIVREVNYVPYWNYLLQKQFDISNVDYRKEGDDFTGNMIVKDWNGNILSIRVMEGGKIIKKVSTKRNSAANTQKAAKVSDYICETVEYCMMYQECTMVGDVMTDDCGEPYFDYSDCYTEEQCYWNDEEDPCVLYGECEGYEPPTQIDPCAEAQTGSSKADVLSQSSTFLSSKNNILTAGANDGREHGISFGKDASGNIITSSMTTGTTNSTGTSSVSNKFADLHNHLGYLPPSSGDLYGFIDIVSNNSIMETRYIVLPNGTVYALIVTDLQAAKDFNINYPRVQNPGFEPDFPEALVDEFREIKYVYNATDEMAMAFILTKYNAGVALLKQNSNGDFKRLNTQQTTDSNGNTMYVANNCQ